jgi:hypothetical protein
LALFAFRHVGSAFSRIAVSLEVLANAPDGMTKGLLLAHGLYSLELLVDLVHAGLASDTRARRRRRIAA